MMLSRLKDKKGFTLIEMMVVISVIAILVAIALPRFANARRAANTAKIAADLRTIDGAINIYYLNHNAYPETTNFLSKSALCTEKDVKYFVSVPKPPSGQFYFATDIGGVGRVSNGGMQDYWIFKDADHTSSGKEISRAGLLVPEIGGRTAVFSLEHFVGFSSISNDAP